MVKRGKYHCWITEDGLKQLEAWARDGLTDEQVAKNIGIARGTLYSWKKKYPDIDDALKRGKAVVDIEVENALLKRALGYEYEEVRQVISIDAEGNERKEQVKTKKLIPPDTTAQIFWLKNRKPAEWRDRHELQHGGKIDISERADEIEKRLFGKEK